MSRHSRSHQKDSATPSIQPSSSALASRPFAPSVEANATAPAVAVESANPANPDFASTPSDYTDRLTIVAPGGQPSAPLQQPLTLGASTPSLQPMRDRPSPPIMQRLAIAPLNPLTTHTNQPSHPQPQPQAIAFSNSQPENRGDIGRSLPIQPKLTIGAPNDKYEQEADRVAQQVVQRLSFSNGEQSANGKTPPSQPNQTLQREVEPDEEDELQMKPLTEQIQRMELPDDDELQMKPLLQRQGSGAVAASDDLESAIQQSRGGGQPLADSIREPMEQAFGGVDFSGVKVHTDGRSDQLNRSIQAKAFTTGHDIFFRKGGYEPGSRGGQELIAHELTHVVQQNGGAVQRSSLLQPNLLHQSAEENISKSNNQLLQEQYLNDSLQKSRQIVLQSSSQDIIQRNIGFEFEVTKYPVTKMTRLMQPAESSGANIIPSAVLDNSQLSKGDRLAIGTGFELQIDEGRNDKHLEFVTTGVGFPENENGRNALKTTMGEIEALGHQVEQNVGASSIKIDDGKGANWKVIQPSDIAGGLQTPPPTLIYGIGQMEAAPQTTAGIRLDQIPNLIQNMVPTPGEDPQETQDRTAQRSTLSGKASGPDTAVLTNAESDVRRAITTFKNQIQNPPVLLPANFGSEKLVGLMSLIYTYLKKGQSRVSDYPKSLFPMLGITNFSSMFNLLPMEDKQPFIQDPQSFEDINLDAAGLAGTGATAFFAGGFAPQLTNMTLEDSQQVANVLGLITRHDWLSNIPQGEDYLSKYYTRSFSGIASTALESMGKFNRGEQVGKPRGGDKSTATGAPILELRRHADHLGINNWKDWALDIYDFIVQLNDLKTDRFKRRRYDFRNPKQ